MKRILLTLFLLTHSSFAFADGRENLSFYVGAGVSYVVPGSFTFGAVLDNHKWGYHGTYEKESFKQAQTSPSD